MEAIGTNSTQPNLSRRNAVKVEDVEAQRRISRRDFIKQSGIDTSKKLPSEGFNRPWPLLIMMDESVKAKVEKLFNP